MGRKSSARFRKHCVALSSIFVCAISGLAQSSVDPARSSETASGRFALVIGNQKYPIGALENPVNDAYSIRGALEPLGFHVRVLTDRPKEEMRAEIEDWTSKLTPNSVAVFYYAGHGIEIGGANYLIPIDFQATTEDLAKHSSINVDWIRERLEKSGAVLRVIILDACRNNPFRRTRGGASGLLPMPGAEGTFIASSTGPGYIASDGTGDQRNGLFTGYLVEALKREGAELNDLFGQVRLRVLDVTKKHQNPWVNTGVIGKFYFRPPSGWVDPRFQRRASIDANGEQRGGSLVLSPERAEIRDAHLRRGKSLLETGSVQQAFAELHQAVQIDGRNVEALRLLAETQIRQQMLEPAIASLTRALQIAPAAPDLFKLRGYALSETARYPEAIEDLSRALELAPDARSYWLRRAARLRVGDLAGAEADGRSQRELANPRKSARP